MVDVDRIRSIARRRVWGDAWEDVAQTACLLGLQFPRTTPGILVVEACRRMFKDKRRSALVREAHNPAQLEHPERLASHYPTPMQLWERWHDEANEDQADEWRALPADERSKRAAESMRALGTSEVTW